MTEFDYFSNVRTAYTHQGEGQDVILLHGWGQNMEMMAKIEEHLASSFSVYNLDFPGFGQSEQPPVAWGVPEYETFLESFVEKNHIENPIIIAHSFGCRVAIRYAAKTNNVLKMCLTGAAGIRPKHGLSWHVQTKSYKVGKWFLEKTGNQEALERLRQSRGSSDYRNASGVMKETFVKVVNDDVTPILKDVTCPVLLVWGELDEAVPLAVGKQMEQLLPDAGLAIFQGDDHFAYWHQWQRFNLVLDAFLEKEQG